MNAKKGHQSAVWGMLFSYLVVSKVLYYFDMIATALVQGGILAMGEAVLSRLLTQDVLIILVILLTFNTENLVTKAISKYSMAVNHIVVHIIDYVIYMVVLAIYFWVMVSVGVFQGFSWSAFFIHSSSVYVVIVAATEGKKYLKKKELTGYAHVLSADEKLAMLKTLRDNDVLTQEEYESKYIHITQKSQEAL